MALCCLETAILDALRGLTCTPIRSENHFVNIRKCTDCMPYLVVKTSSSGGLRTSEGYQKTDTVEIAAYFKSSNETAVTEYRDLVDAWMNAAGCLDLGVCGCFCVRGNHSSKVAPASGDAIRYSLSFSGTYAAVDVASASASV